MRDLHPKTIVVRDHLSVVIADLEKILKDFGVDYNDIEEDNIGHYSKEVQEIIKIICNLIESVFDNSVAPLSDAIEAAEAANTEN